ncbi:SDR family oxidoreductase [Rhizobium sp. 0TCS1.26]|uniref:SDR family oxidoreductase n=1 Tax=Rhizobium sp. 0TCS1.26 TaxID=3142623 RepID=UPI003D2C6689
MTQKTILITGANKSIGFETARQLGALGHRIWLGSRDGARGQAAVERLVGEGHDVRLLEIDVVDDGSVRQAVGRMQQEDGRLDVLINNAGIPGGMSKPSQQELADIRTVYETNVFAPIRVTQAFLPLLRSAGGGSVIMVSSGLGSLGWVNDPSHPFHAVNILGYNSSKTALNAVTVAFAKELAAESIHVNSVDPGYTATDFNGHSGYRSAEQAAAGIVWLASQDGTGPTGGFYFDQAVVPW